MWLLWAPLTVALLTAAGATFTYGYRRWADLLAVRRVAVGSVALPVIGVEIVALLVVNVTAFVPGAGWNWRGAVVMPFVFLAAVPAVGTMYGVRLAATADARSNSPGGQAALLIDLRRLHQRLLATIGSLVALSTLQHGAVLALERSVDGPLSARPPQYVLIFGGVGSLLLALVFVPGWTALRNKGVELCDRLFSLHGLRTPSAIVAKAEERQKMEQVLGVDRSVLTEMQSNIFILSPLLASAAATFLPG